MKAMVVNNEVLILGEIEKPIPKTGEILVKVMASSVNRTDVINRKSASAYVDFPVLGVEIAGIVVETYKGSPVKIGTKVMGLVNGGAYAEYAIIHEDSMIEIPEMFLFEEAAAIPEVFLTAYQTLYWLGKLNERETVLIHAGGSGVGTAAIQLAKQLSHANVITTAGTDEKLAFCQQLGADIVINYHK